MTRRLRISRARDRHQVRRWQVRLGSAGGVAKTVASTIFALIYRCISMIGEYIGLEKRDHLRVVLFSYRVSWLLPADFNGLRSSFEGGYKIGYGPDQCRRNLIIWGVREK